jgi:hypothetical protein
MNTPEDITQIIHALASLLASGFIVGASLYIGKTGWKIARNYFFAADNNSARFSTAYSKRKQRQYDAGYRDNAGPY